MRAIVFGGSGMIGQGVTLECLDDGTVSAVTVVGRSPCGLEHPKLREVLHRDFFDYSAIRDELAGHDACFFCLGVSAAGKGEAEYSRLTHDLTLAAADALVKASPDVIFCYVSGAGTDGSEQGRTMWARVKGRTENDLLGLPFRAAFMFRPGYVQPLRGVRSKTPVYQALYTVAAPLYPVWKRLFPDAVTTTVNVGKAMIRVVRDGYPRPIVETRDINMLAGERMG